MASDLTSLPWNYRINTTLVSNDGAQRKGITWKNEKNEGLWKTTWHCDKKDLSQVYSFAWQNGRHQDTWCTISRITDTVTEKHCNRRWRNLLDLKATGKSSFNYLESQDNHLLLLPTRKQGNDSYQGVVCIFLWQNRLLRQALFGKCKAFLSNISKENVISFLYINMAVFSVFGVQHRTVSFGVWHMGVPSRLKMCIKFIITL